MVELLPSALFCLGFNKNSLRLFWSERVILTVYQTILIGQIPSIFCYDFPVRTLCFKLKKVCVHRKLSRGSLTFIMHVWSNICISSFVIMHSQTETEVYTTLIYCGIPHTTAREKKRFTGRIEKITRKSVRFLQGNFDELHWYAFPLAVIVNPVPVIQRIWVEDKNNRRCVISSARNFCRLNFSPNASFQLNIAISKSTSVINRGYAQDNYRRLTDFLFSRKL